MNKTIMIASAITAGTAAVLYFRNRMKAVKQPEPVAIHNTHHLTEVFAKAKNRQQSAV